jgi:LPS-assembly lipoprotein
MTGQNDTPQRYILKINGSGYAAYKFRRELEKQLALTPKVNDKAYVITVSLTESYIATTYGTDATVSRSQVQSTAAYTIMDCNKPVAQGTLAADSSYQLNYREEFATRSAQAAAVERTLMILAEDLAREVTLKIREKTR